MLPSRLLIPLLLLGGAAASGSAAHASAAHASARRPLTHPARTAPGLPASGAADARRVPAARAVPEVPGRTATVPQVAARPVRPDAVATPSLRTPVRMPARALGRRATAVATSPAAYGAVGDGVHDDTAALQRALDAASATSPLVLPAGSVFAHAGVLHVRVPGEVVTGGGTLLATAEATSSVWVEASGVTVSDVVVRTAGTTRRWSAWEQMGLRLLPTTGVTVRDVSVVGSAAAGIYVGGATHFLLDHVTVSDTRADGIHMTGGAADGAVVDPTTTETGDDGVAVVSYGSDAQPCHDITVTGAKVLGTTGGRGMSVVGGTAISYVDVDVERSAAAGIYVADEGDPYDTYAPHDVTVTGGRVVGANTDPTIDHGAVLVVSGRDDDAPSGIAISGLAISGTRATASRDVGVIVYGADPSDIVLSDFTITGGPPSAYQGNAPAGTFRTVAWTQDGRPLPDQG